MRHLFASAVVLLIAACAQAPRTPEALESIETPKIGTLETAYDRTKWRWVKNRDGRALLTHTDVPQCFVDPQPPLDVHDAGFTLKRHEKAIGATRYQVVSVYEQRDFWEAIYTRPGARTPTLSVYAEGRCQQEAERILEAYERAR